MRKLQAGDSINPALQYLKFRILAFETLHSEGFRARRHAQSKTVPMPMLVLVLVLVLVLEFGFGFGFSITIASTISLSTSRISKQCPQKAPLQKLQL